MRCWVGLNGPPPLTVPLGSLTSIQPPSGKTVKNDTEEEQGGRTHLQLPLQHAADQPHVPADSTGVYPHTQTHTRLWDLEASSYRFWEGVIRGDSLSTKNLFMANWSRERSVLRERRVFRRWSTCRPSPGPSRLGHMTQGSAWTDVLQSICPLCSQSDQSDQSRRTPG